MRGLLLVLLMLTGLGTGSAQEVEMDDHAPTDVQATMRSGGISLQFGEVPIGQEHQKVLLHIYVVPGSQTAVGGHTPLRREEIVSGTSIVRSPFYADLLVREKGKLKRLNTVSVTEDGDCRVQLRWLEPKIRRGPVLLLRFGVGDEGEWHVFAFPDGIEQAATHQFFGFTADEENEGNTLDLDGVDSHGMMTVQEHWWAGKKRGMNRYPWDGVEFADRSRPYFVIAASVKTRAEAEAFVQRHKGLEESEIRPSSHYPKLTPGYFVVIANRLPNLKDAEEFARDQHKDGADCYVKRAF